MNGLPEISVAISTMERPESMARCLTSILGGELLPSEIVIVDQSRDDATEHLVREFSGSPMPIQLHRQQPRGLGASQNQAVRAASSEVVAITDDDCVVDPRWLVTIARAFGETPSLGALGGRVLPLPDQRPDLWPVSSRTSPVRRDFVGGGAPWHVGSGNNFAVRRDLFLHIGGCDERLGPGSPAQGGVDIDLFYRFLRSGAHLCYEPRAIVFHEQQTLAQRKARRPMYGHGMGAAIAYRLQEGDRKAIRLLGSWIALRAAMLGRALLQFNTVGMREELTMIGSTVRGFRHGYRHRTY